MSSSYIIHYTSHIIHTSYTHHTHIIHTSYTHHTHIIHTSYTHHIHIIHTSYTHHTHPPYTHTYTLHTGKHNKKTSAFVKACLAFCHITVPSLDDIFIRLHMFLQCAQAALLNNMVGQAEAYIKACIAWIAEVPAYIQVDRRSRSTEAKVADYIMNLASLLVVFPVCMIVM